MNAQQIVAKRLQIGILALLCLGTAVGLWFFSENPEHDGFLAAITRVGLVLGAIWLALPAKGESVVWQKAAPALVGAVVVASLAKRYFLYALPVALVLGLALVFLRPRSKRRR
ncbi:MAG: hypothetical protein ACKV0T_05540 [Planctomycetales bacterium]